MIVDFIVIDGMVKKFDPTPHVSEISVCHAAKAVTASKYFSEKGVCVISFFENMTECSK